MIRRLQILLMAAGFAVILPATVNAENVAESTPLSFNSETNQVLVTCKVEKLGTYSELGGRIEYLLTGPGGKAYESLLSCNVKASDLLAALKKLKMIPGSPARLDRNMVHHQCPKGAPVQITARWTKGDVKHSVPAEDLFLDTTTGKSPVEVPWTLTGSQRGKDPETDAPVLNGDLNGNLIALHLRDSSVLIQNARPTARDFRRWKPNLKVVPGSNTVVTLVFEKAPVSRKNWVVSGEVRNVGYRSFVQRHALLLGIAGWVRNSSDGHVEIVAQGRPKSLASFEAAIRKGPRGAVVNKVEDGERALGKLLGGFLIRETINKKVTP